jgi:uncharacterized protein YerC
MGSLESAQLRHLLSAIASSRNGEWKFQFFADFSVKQRIQITILPHKLANWQSITVPRYSDVGNARQSFHRAA